MGSLIESEELRRLARRVADMTGKSPADAVQEALEEKLARLERLREEQVAQKKRRLKEILDGLPPRPPAATSDHSDLYDERGLPK